MDQTPLSNTEAEGRRPAALSPLDFLSRLIAAARESGLQDAAMVPRPLRLQSLEDRILLNAAPVDAGLTVDAADVSLTVDPAGSDSNASSLMGDSGSNEVDDVLAAVRAGSEQADWLETAASRQDNAADQPSEDVRNEIVFVDQSVDGWRDILNDLWGNSDASRELDVVLLSTARDGIEQITTALDGREGIDAIHILSHGTGGSVQLGATLLTTDDFDQYVGNFLAWRGALSEDADLLLYGCDLAGTDDGRRLVEQLGTLCDCDVAASTDVTGHISLDGDWDLEFVDGEIEATLAVSDDLIATWVGTLDITTDLFARYEFEENAGTTPLDTSINSNDGSFINSPTYTATAAVGSYALDFTGDAANSNHVIEVSDDNTLDFGRDLTIAFWYNSSVAQADGTSIIESIGATDGFRVSADADGTLNWFLDDGNDTVTLGTSGFISDSAWHHVALTRNEATNAVRMYIDGTSVFSGTASSINIVNPSASVRIGGQGATGSDYEGLLDDIRFFERELTSSDVTELYALGPVSTAPTNVLITSGAADGLSLNEAGNNSFLLASDASFLTGTQITMEFQISDLQNTGTAATLYSNVVAAGTSDFKILSDGRLSFAGFNSTVATPALFGTGDHTVAFTFNGGTGDLRYYVDGQFVEQVAGPIGTFVGGNFVIGQDQDTLGGPYDPDEAFSGKLRDVRIFDAVRSAAELSASHNQLLPHDEADLVINWRFDQLSTENVILDAVGGRNLTVEQTIGAGFSSGTPNIVLAADEYALNGTSVGTVAAIDADRTALIASLLAADSNLRYSAETGKFYKGIAGSINWSSASTAALGTTLNGVNGQLAAIRSAEEQTLLAGIAGDVGGDVWLGGTDQDVEGEFRWMQDGASVDQFWSGDENGRAVGSAYTNWDSGRPDNFAGIQHFVFLQSDGTWNDESSVHTTSGYAVEWDADEVLDATQALTYSLAGQTVAGAFAIDSDDGEITVADGSLIDFESDPAHTLTVRVTDVDGLTHDEAVTISIRDVAGENTSPTDLAAGIALNTDGGNDAYLIADDGAAVFGNRQALTFETRFAVESTTDFTTLVSYVAGHPTGNDFKIHIQNTGVQAGRLNAYVAGNNIFSDAIDFRTLNDGSIHSLAFSWDNTSGAWALYVDGEYVDSGVGGATGVVIPNAGELVFGQEQDAIGGGFDDNEQFRGTLYDVRVWDDVRSAEEIALNYRHRLDSSNLPTSLVANWQMTGFTLGQVVDVKNGNNLDVGHAAGVGFTASTPVAGLSISENSSNGTSVGFVVPTDANLHNDVVIDGRFNEGVDPGVFTVYSTGQSFGGWTVDSGQVGHIGTHWDTSPRGGYTVDLNGPAAGTISQTLSTEAGRQYQVAFAVTGNWESGTSDKDFRVAAGGTSADFTVEHDAIWSTSNLLWQHRSITFTASGANTELVFESLIPTGDGAVIGDVQVTELPQAVSTILNNDPTLSYDAATGKFYRVVTTAADVATAISNAAADALNGVEGQLVTIRSTYENDVVQSLISGQGSSFYIGATDATSEGAWNWIEDGSEADRFWNGGSSGSSPAGAYSNWHSGEPSESGGGEDYAAIRESDGLWLDLSGAGLNGYVVEWDASEVLSSFTFQLTDSAGGRFAINGSTGEITVANGSLLDFETNTSHNVTVEVRDAAGASYSESLAIAVGDEAEGATVTSPVTLVVNEDASGTFSGAGGNAITFAGVDDSKPLTTTLKVANGTLTLGGTAGITFLESTTNGTDTLTIAGTQAAINAALEGLVYTPTPAFHGVDSLKIATGSSVLAEANLYARYEFDSGATTDQSGNGLDGVSGGDPTLTADSERGDVLTFDGDDSVTINNGVLGLGDEVTFLAWVNLDAGQQENVFLSIGDEFYVTLDRTSASHSMAVHTGTFTSNSLDADDNIAGEGWNHVAATFDDIDKELHLYLNGELVRSTSFAFSDVNWGTATSPNITIGSLADGSNSFVGSLDDVRIYDSELTQAQIVSVMGDHGVATADVAITITAVDDPPALTTNVPLSVPEESSRTITSAFLAVTDSDTSAANIVYTLTQLPGGDGSVRLSGATLSLGQTFTQDDIDNNRLTFHFGDDDSIETFRFTVSDGTTTLSEAVFSVSSPSVNDAPVNTVPGTQTFAEATASAVTGLSIADIDAASANLTTRLQVSAGQLDVTLAGAASVSAGANGSSDLTILGTVGDINATLTSLTYTGNVGVSGVAADSLTVTTNDGGNTGSGGPLQDVDNIQIDITPVINGVSHSLPGAQSVNEDAALTFSAAGGNAITVDDGTAATDTRLQVWLGVQGFNGTITLSQTTGLSFPGGSNGSPSMVIWGSEADINAALEGAVFTPDPDYNGPANINIETKLAADSEGHYRFENIGNIGSDSSVGVSQTGTGRGDATVVADSTRGNVLDLSGAGDIEIASDFDQTQEITVAAWVNVDAAAATGTVIDVGGDLALRVEGGGGWGVFGTYNDGSVWQSTISTQMIGGTGWRHIAYVVDGSNNEQRLYIDGAQVALSLFANDIQDVSTSAFSYMGSNGGSSYVEGRIDDARIYTRALSDDDIATLAADGADVSGTIMLTVNNVNDAPTVGGGTLTAIAEDDLNPVGDAITNLFGGTFADADTGSSMSGIAVTSNNAPLTEGVWQYSTDGGTNWFDIGAVDGSSSVALDASTRVRFLPAADFNGPATIMSLRALDDTYAGGFTSGATRVTTNTTSPGGASPISSSLVSLSHTVTAVNDAATIATNNVLAISGGSTGNVIGASLLEEGDPDDSGAGLSYRVDTDVVNGTLRRLGVALTSGSTFTQEDIDLNRITYDHDGSNTTADSFDFSLNDGGEDGTLPVSGTFNISISAINIAPVITSGPGGGTYNEGGTGTFFNNSLTVADADSADFDGGTTTVTITAAGEADDRLIVRDGNNVSVAGSNVQYDFGGGQITIGTFAGGTGLTPLVVTFNANATLTSVEAVAQQIAFRSVSDTPSTTQRSLSMVITDGDGGTSNTANRVMNVVAVNDAPTFGNLAASLANYTEGGPAVILDNDAQILDAELNAADSFGGSTLTLERNGGANTDDVFSATGTITDFTEGDDIVMAGVTIGALDTNSGGTLLVTFYNDATGNLVNQFVRQLAYANASSTPPGNVQIDWTFNDRNSGTQGIGAAASVTGSTTVSINATNNAPTITAVANQTINEDGTTGPLAFSVSDAESAAGTLLVTATSNNTTIIPDGNLALVDLGGGNWTIQATPVADQNGGPVTVTLTVDDGTDATQTSFDVTVTAINDNPVIDLNGGDGAGANFATMFTEGGGPATAFDTDATVSDVDHTTYNGVGINLAGFVDGIDEEVIVGGHTFRFGVADVVSRTVGATTFDVDFDGSGFSISRFGPGVVPLADLQSLLRGIQYNHASADPTTGLRTLTVQVTDAAGANSANAISSIAVAATNNAPTLTAFGSAVGVTAEDTEVEISLAAVLATGNEADIDGSVTAFRVTSITSGTLRLGADAASATAFAAGSNDRIDAANRAYWTPAGDSNGILNAFHIVAVDDLGAESTTPVVASVIVTAVNDAPTITAIGDQTINEDATTGPLGFTVDDVESAAGALTVTATSNNTTIIPDGNLTLVDLGGGNWTIEATPQANQNGGPVTIAVKVDDGTTTTDETFAVTVSATNDNPTVTAIGDQTINEDGSTGPLAFSVSDVETDLSSLVVSATSNNQALIPDGNLTLVDLGSGNWTIEATPAADQHGGPATITVTVDDGTSNTQSTFAVTVAAVNDAPVDALLSNASVNENVANGTVVGQVSAVDVDSGDTHQFALLDDANGRFIVDQASGVVTVSDSNGLNFEQASGHQITVRVTDGDGASHSETFTITVADLNEAPFGQDLQFTTNQVGEIRLDTPGLVALGTDEDGDALSIRLVSDVTGGQLVFNADGSFTYTPDALFEGTDSFSYRLSDGVNESAPLTVSIEVEAIAPAPDGGNGISDAGQSDSDSADADSNELSESDSDEDAPDDSSSTSSNELPPSTSSGQAAGSVQATDAETATDVAQETVVTTDSGQAIPEMGAAEIQPNHTIESTIEFDRDTRRDTRETQGRSERTSSRDARSFRTSYVSDPVSAVPLRIDLERLDQESEDSEETGMINDELVIGTTKVVSTSLTVGYVVWMVRGGTLVASLMASLPAWTAFDPLAIVSAVDSGSFIDDGESLSDLVVGDRNTGPEMA